MTDPDPLLAAIRRTPDDRTLRLAYADWLDERADPRGELVRVCEGMRDLPVWSNRYWELKARRNDLRPDCPADWLSATGYDGSRYDPLFRDGIPDDWRGQWRLVREFTERWHGVPMPDVGGRREEVRAAEERLRLELPPSLREWVAFQADENAYYGPIIRTEDEIQQYEVRRLQGLPALSFWRERFVIPGASTEAVVRLDELHQPDPPVYNYHVGTDSLPSTSFPAFHGVASVAFRSVATTVYMRTSGYNLDPARGRDLLPRLEGVLPIRAAFGRIDVLEGDQILVVTERPPSYQHVRVYVRDPLPAEAVPEAIREAAVGGWSRHGMFSLRPGEEEVIPF